MEVSVKGAMVDLEHLERMKESQRMQFDYFKHLTTLSSGSIAVVATLLAKVFPSATSFALPILSLLSFFVCITVSLWAMTAAGNAILYLTGTGIIASSTVKNPQELEINRQEYDDKFNKALDKIGCYDKITMGTFLIGVALFLVFVAIALMTRH
jgi:hypothetical protein